MLNLVPAVSRNYQCDVIQPFTDHQRGFVWCPGMESLSLRMSPLPQGFRSPLECHSSHGGDLPGSPLDSLLLLQRMGTHCRGSPPHTQREWLKEGLERIMTGRGRNQTSPWDTLSSIRAGCSPLHTSYRAVLERKTFQLGYCSHKGIQMGNLRPLIVSCNYWSTQ